MLKNKKEETYDLEKFTNDLTEAMRENYPELEFLVIFRERATETNLIAFNRCPICVVEDIMKYVEENHIEHMIEEEEEVDNEEPTEEGPKVH